MHLPYYIYIYIYLFLYTTYISSIPGLVHPHLWLNVMFLSSENVRIAKPEPLKPSRYVIDCPFANFVRRCVECVVEGSLGCIYNLFLLMYCVSIRCICKNLQNIQMYMYVISKYIQMYMRERERLQRAQLTSAKDGSGRESFQMTPINYIDTIYTVIHPYIMHAHIHVCTCICISSKNMVAMCPT